MKYTNNTDTTEISFQLYWKKAKKTIMNNSLKWIYGEKYIWKDIRSLIAIKHLSASNIHMLTHKGATVTDPLHIANIFNHYFGSIIEKTKVRIKWP